MKKTIFTVLTVFSLLLMNFACAEEISSDFTCIRISEIMASNSSRVISTADGSAPDWIEIVNISDKDINLKGLCLSDSKKKLEKFVFPDVILPAGEHMIIFCTGKESTEDHEIHVGFKLAAEGEKVVLSYQGVILDKVTFEAQLRDIALALDENGNWVQTVTPTPGAPNVITGLN